ncbi:MAG TPA: cytochrome P450 [Streptosporangiaceae bacterium]|nr:cytochrome P450 [Streptosporangiaceae bacterium]
MREPMITAFAESVTVGQLEADPYPVYARLRREAPVCFVPAVGLWFVTRYDDVEYVVTHPAQFTAEMSDSPVDRTFGSPTIITVDGDRHQDLRRGLDSKYRPRQVNGYIDDLVRPIAERMAVRLAGGRAELMAEYFEPVSVLSLGSVLGIEAFGEERLRDWFWRLHQGVINFEGNSEREQIGSACSREIDVALGPVFDRLEAAGDDSTISHLLHSGVPEGGCRARDYVMPTLKVILLGGMQEPGHGGGSTLAALLTDRSQFEAVREDPGLLPSAVEEGLRWMSPIGTQTRQAVADIEIGGAVIPAGAPVGALVSAANRDETRFTDPDRFDIFRPRQVNLAFGGGRHFCAGHAFSRAQIRIAIEVLLQRYPQIALDPARLPEFRGWEFRAPRKLEVLLG